MALQRTLLATATIATLLTSAAFGQTFRLGNEPYRYVDDAPVGDAHFRSQPTFNTYYRPTRNGDDQIGPDPDEQIGRMADDLDHHLKTSYRHDLPEYNRRYVHFRAAMDGWNGSEKSDEDMGQMTQWLKTSIKYSMPGSDNFLPPLPKVNPVDLDSDSTHAPSVLDPFRDDPVQTAPR